MLAARYDRGRRRVRKRAPSGRLAPRPRGGRGAGERQRARAHMRLVMSKSPNRFFSRSSSSPMRAAIFGWSSNSARRTNTPGGASSDAIFWRPPEKVTATSRPFQAPSGPRRRARWECLPMRRASMGLLRSLRRPAEPGSRGCPRALSLRRTASTKSRSRGRPQLGSYTLGLHHRTRALGTEHVCGGPGRVVLPFPPLPRARTGVLPREACERSDAATARRPTRAYELGTPASKQATQHEAPGEPNPTTAIV